MLIWNKDYVVLGNEHGVMEQEWLLRPYTTVPNNKPDFPLLVSSSLPSGHFFWKSCYCSFRKIKIYEENSFFNELK